MSESAGKGIKQSLLLRASKTECVQNNYAYDKGSITYPAKRSWPKLDSSTMVYEQPERRTVYPQRRRKSFFRQVGAGEVSLAFDHAPISDNGGVLDYPLRCQVAAQTIAVGLWVCQETSTLESLSEQLPQSALRKNIGAITVNQKLNALLLGQLDQGRGHVAAVLDVDLVDCRPNLYSLEEPGKLLAAEFSNAEIPHQPLTMQVLNSRPCIGLLFVAALRRIQLIGLPLTVSLEGHAGERHDEKGDLLHAQLPQNEVKCLLCVLRAIRNGPSREEEQLDGDVVLRRLFL